jgi:hypothetical protein
MPTGYNPEQVDDALNSIAERLVAGEAIADLVGHASFEVADVGYAQAEVDHFFAELAHQAELPADASAEEQDATDDAPAEEASADSAVEDEQPASEPATVAEQQLADDADEHAEAEVDESAPEPAIDLETIEADDAWDASDDVDEVPSVTTEDWDDDADDSQESDAAYVGAPREVVWQAPTTGELDLNVLSEAVDRTAETLGSLRGFIDNEIVAMKLAVERQAQETAKRCEQLLHDTSTEAAALTESVNAEIARARKAAERQAERDRRELAKELKQARAECDAEVAATRKDAEEYAAKVRAEADSDRAEAQRTIENAIGMQASIAESLERARQQLTPAQRDDLAA